MNAEDFDELAGRIEGLARVVLHLVARLEDGAVIDGPAMAEGLRHSIVLNAGSGLLMVTAKRTLENAASALDEARQWRKFRKRVVTPPTRPCAKRKQKRSSTSVLTAATSKLSDARWKAA